MSGADLVASLEKEIDTLISKYDTLYDQYTKLERSIKTIGVHTYPPVAYFSAYDIQNGGFVAAKTPHIRFNGTQITYIVEVTDLNYGNNVALIVFNPVSCVMSIPVVAICGPTQVHTVKTEELDGDQSMLGFNRVNANYSKCAVFSGYVANNTTFTSTYLHFEFISSSQVQYLGKTDNIADDEYLVPINLIIDAYI